MRSSEMVHEGGLSADIPPSTSTIFFTSRDPWRKEGIKKIVCSRKRVKLPGLTFR